MLTANSSQFSTHAHYILKNVQFRRDLIEIYSRPGPGAGMTFIPAGTGIEMKTRPGPGFFQYFSISVKMKQCYMLNKIFQNKLRYVKLKLTVSSSNYSLSISLYLSLSLSISLSISLFISEIESASALIGGSTSGFDICRTTVFSGRKHG